MICFGVIHAVKSCFAKGKVYVYGCGLRLLGNVIDFLEGNRQELGHFVDDKLNGSDGSDSLRTGK